MAEPAVSLRHLVPLGGEEADRLVGELRPVLATGEEAFDPRRELESGEHPRPGEVVWRHDAGVTCRRWNWRQGRRSRLPEATQRAFFVLDALAPLPAEALRTAVAELAEELERGWPGVELAVASPTAGAAPP